MRKEKRHSPGVESLYTGNFASVRARNFPQNPRVGQGMRIRKNRRRDVSAGRVAYSFARREGLFSKNSGFRLGRESKKIRIRERKTPSGSRNANLRSQENATRRLSFSEMLKRGEML